MLKALRILQVLLWVPWMVALAMPGQAQSLTAFNKKATKKKVVSTVSSQQQLTRVLADLEKLYRVSFNYDNDLLAPLAGNVTVPPQAGGSVEQALSQLLPPFQLQAEKLAPDVYAIVPAPSAGHVQTVVLAKPARATVAMDVSGRVVARSGEGLPGVTVLVKGTTIGTTTGADGRFSLSVPNSGDILIFSFVGFVTRELAVPATPRLLQVVLEDDTKALEEVVVVGYGTQKKTSVTAAVSTMKGADVATVPVANLSNTLGGRLSGVIVKQGSGEPGRDGTSIFIRGISSTGANQPLLIVDNIPRSFQQLDPNTIESFTILKDAAAVAPYGVAGANGVVLVTTKRGKIGAPALSYNGYVGFQNPTVLPDYATSYQYAILKNAAAKNEGLPLPYSDFALQKFLDGSDTDAFPRHDVRRDLIEHNSPMTSHNIELSGGVEKMKYYASLGYQYQGGMWQATNNNRYNLAINLDAQVTSTTNMGLNVNGWVQRSLYPSISTSRIFELLSYAHPGNGPLFYSNGMNGSYVTGSILKSGYQQENTTAVYTQLSLEQEIPFIPGLNLKGTVAYDPTLNMSKLWKLPVHLASIDTSKKPYVITDGIFGQTKPSLEQSFTNSHQLTYQAGLNYGRTFGKSRLGLLGLFEAKSNDMLRMALSRRNYNLMIDEIDLGSSSNADMTTSGISSTARQMGVVYRLTYDFADKYLFEASGRYDGSYYFAPENRFGFFPAYSIGWRLSEEPFLKNKVTWLDNLKLRASYGEVGALAGSPFQYMSTYSVAGPAYVIGGNAVQAVRERAEPNPSITWERAKKTDIGWEGTLWKGLLSFEADYFYEKRSNMLVNPDVVLPSEYGIGLSQVNAGIMENRGLDLSVSSVYQVNADLRVSLGGNFTYARNKLLQVFETPTTFNNPNRRLTGRPLGTQFGYQALGFFQLSDFDESGNLRPGIALQPWGRVQPGDIRYEDLNGDGKINDNDLTAIGDPVSSPRIVYGISPNVRFKNFSLDVLLQGAAKTNFYYQGDAGWAFHNGMGAFEDHLNYWTPENPHALNPRITSAPTANNTQRSSFWMGDARYLRLKSATLAYALPTALVQQARMQQARVYVSTQNLLTWTPLRNFDPEVNHRQGWTYPQQQVMSLGLNLTF